METQLNRRDALKALAALPLAGGLTASISPAAECDCCDIPAVLDCTISDCCDNPPDYFTLSTPAGTEVRYEWDGDWWRPAGELPEGFPLGFRWGSDLRIEEMEPGVGIVSPCCGA